MDTYPSIEGPAKAPRQPCIAFVKYDGSNLRFEWTKKRGWTKYGSRRRLLDETDEALGGAIRVFHETLASPLEDIFKKHYRDAQKITVFCEWFGDQSFSGQHIPGDAMRLVLFDVKIHKKGFVSPRDFVKHFCRPLGDLAAAVVYDGNLTAEFVRAVQAGQFSDRGVWEGVVCKGGAGHKMWRCKIKTDAYRQKLQEVYEDGWEQFWGAQ